MALLRMRKAKKYIPSTCPLEKLRFSHLALDEVIYSRQNEFRIILLAGAIYSAAMRVWT
jgi:hypothetical protein